MTTLRLRRSSSMTNGGIDASTWLILIGMVVVLFGIPGFLLEYDRRKQLRQPETRRPTDESD
jgi:hypothetical protein